MVKNSPSAQETWVRSLVQEDHLETGMANHSSILAWRIPWTEETGRLQSVGPKELNTNEILTLTLSPHHSKCVKKTYTILCYKTLKFLQLLLKIYDYQQLSEL